MDVGVHADAGFPVSQRDDEVGRFAAHAGQCEQFVQIVRGIEKSLGVKPEKFVAIGGATRNEFWIQNKADMIGKPIETPRIDEPTPLGAAILAGIGVGLYADVQDAYEKVYKPGKVYQPNLKLTEKYRRWLKTFERVYPSLKDLNARLRNLSA